MLPADGARHKTSRGIRPPASLRFGIGGFSGHSWELAWIDGQLWFREEEHGQGMLSLNSWHPFAAPDSMDWKRLHDLLTRVKAWEWPKKFIDPNVMDGTEWSLKIQWGGLRKSICGSNAFREGFEEVKQGLRKLALQVDSSRIGAFSLPD